MKYIGWIFIFILLWSDCISAQIPDEGYYEIYVHIPSVTSSGSAKRGGGSVRIHADGKEFQRGSWGGGFDNGDVKYMGAPTAQKFLARV